jgi:aryl-alcohol dehydrogenase-like predicted oxidoreductase
MIPLAVGTAQFGQAYGICNKDGAVEGDAAREIVKLALARGIDFFDTARLYGESEAVLGAALPSDKNAQIITKFAGDSAGTEKIRSDCEDSLRRFGRDSVYAILIHNAQSLLEPEGVRIWGELSRLKDEGLVKKIGVSVYTPEEFIVLADRFGPDIVQVPCNLLDQRFLGREVQARKRDGNIEFHARSLFLQGILTNLPDGIPNFMTGRKQVFEKIAEAAGKAGMTMLEFCLSFALSCTDEKTIDRWVVGVDSAAQLSDIADCAGNIKTAPVEWGQFGINAAEIIDPRQWKRNVA